MSKKTAPRIVIEIGTSRNSVGGIITLMYYSETFNSFETKMEKFATELGLNTEISKWLQEQVNAKNHNVRESVKRTLEKWVKIRKEDAILGDLLKALDSIGMQNEAGLLRNAFNVRPASTKVSDPGPSTQVPRSKSLITASSANLKGTQKENFQRIPGSNIYIWNDINNVLGNGATSVVLRGFHIDQDKKAAIKRVQSEYANIYKTELDIWKKIGTTIKKENVNIVQLFEWKEVRGTDSFCYIAMELATCTLGKKIESMKKSSGDLSSSSNNFKQFEKLGWLIKDAAKGLQWLHENKIIHRDIKPDNILIFESTGKTIAKLADFGVSKSIKSLTQGTNSMGRGTLDWMPPEAIEAVQESKSFQNTTGMDIFSLGMTAYFALTLGNHPFDFNNKHHKHIKILNITDMSVEAAKLESSGSQRANHLLGWMMSKPPQIRPNITNVLLHPAFWNQRKCIEFVVEVAKAFDGKRLDDPIIKNIDESYNKFHQEKVNLRKFNWCLSIDPNVYQLLTQRRGNSGPASYNKESLLSLVKLIRDKSVHYQDLRIELLQDQYFGDKGVFRPEKFNRFFLERFPYLTLFLYVSLSRKTSQFLQPLKEKYNIVDPRLSTFYVIN